MDESLTLLDAGRSAFTGEHRKNPDRHALATFLKLVENGRVPRGSYLILENLDRLSREHIRPALTLLLNLIEAGVRVVQLKPAEMIFDEKVEPMQLMMAIMELSRGHSESAIKKVRAEGAWLNRRDQARSNGQVLTRRLPAWIGVVDGKLALIPEKAEAVKRVYQLAASGYGTRGIVRRLIAEGVTPIGRSKKWVAGYVWVLLGDRRAVGEFQPKKHHQPDGPPIPAYFPAVVTEGEWAAARVTSHQQPKRPGRPSACPNLFRGLLVNARDGESYVTITQINHGKKSRDLVTLASIQGRGRRWGFPYPILEASILSRLAEVNPREIIGQAGQDRDEVSELTHRRDQKQLELEAAVTWMDANGFSPNIAKKIADLEWEKQELDRQLAEARARSASPISEAWAETINLLKTYRSAPDPVDAHTRLRSVLRRVIDSIWLHVRTYKRSQRLATVMIWFKDSSRVRVYGIWYRAWTVKGKQKVDWEHSSVAVDGVAVDPTRRQEAMERIRPLVEKWVRESGFLEP